MVAEASIGVVLNSERTSVLLVRRADIPIWVLPGGGVDAEETPEIAVVREVLEETGLKVIADRKVAEYTPINKLAGFTHLYECIVEGGELQTSPESAAVGFHDLNKLPKDFFFIHKYWLDDALQRKPSLIRSTLNHITYSKGIIYLLRHPVIGLRYLLTKARMQ